MNLPHSNPTTSREAARRMTMSAATVRRRILRRLASWEQRGWTDEELCDYLGLSANTVRPARNALVARTLVRDSGRTRKTRSGRDAIVWVEVRG